MNLSGNINLDASEKMVEMDIALEMIQMHTGPKFISFVIIVNC